MNNLLDSLDTRARYGVAALATLVTFVVALHVGDMAAASETQRAAAERQLAQIDASIDGPAWDSRLETAQDAVAAWQSVYWRFETPGLAAVSIETRLREIATTAIMENPRTNVDPDAIDVGGQQFLRFSLSGQVESRSGIATLLSSLATQEQRLIIDEYTFRFGRAGRHFIALQGRAPIEMVVPTAGESE